jgi:hypothetical protein
MILHITEARYLDNYRVEVVFNDGKKGVADLSEILTGEVFEPLKNLDAFTKFHVDYTIIWENGADLAPEYIYFQAFKNDPELQAQFESWGYK